MINQNNSFIFYLIISNFEPHFIKMITSFITFENEFFEILILLALGNDIIESLTANAKQKSPIEQESHKNSICSNLKHELKILSPTFFTDFGMMKYSREESAKASFSIEKSFEF